MNTYSKTFLVVIALSFVASSNAQRFGVVGGLNLAKMTIPYDENDSEKNAIGYHFGITIELPLTKKLALQPSLLYSTKGLKYEYVNPEIDQTNYSVNQFKASLELNYIEMPVNLKLSFPVGPLKVFGAFGPYAAIGISGSSKAKGSHYYNGDYVAQEYENNVEWGNSLGTNNRLDYGLNYGLGVEFKSFQLSGNYSQGIASIYQKQRPVRHKVIKISIAYFVGKNKSKGKEKEAQTEE